MVLPVELCRGFPCRHFLPVAFEWITDGQKKTSWHREREPISSALWGRIYNRMSVYAYSDWAWLLPPHQRNHLHVGTGLWWREWQQEKDVYIYVGPFIQWGLQLPASKSVRPLWRCCGLEVRYRGQVLDIPSSYGKCNKSSYVSKVRGRCGCFLACLLVCLSHNIEHISFLNF